MAEPGTSHPTVAASAVTGTNTHGPGASWDSYLAEQLKLSARFSSFDMDDDTDAEWINRVPLLQQAVAWLNTQLLPLFQAADKAASADQGMHRRLARIAIVTGGLSIVLAVIQLALINTASGAEGSIWTEVIKGSEALAVACGVVAVGVGLYAKFEHKWLTERHKAERFRMLKFRALGRTEFWSGNTAQWRQWVEREIEEIKLIHEVDELREWTSGGRAEPEFVVPPMRTVEPPDADIATYYRRKRVDFQSDYFLRQSTRLGKHSGMLNKPGLFLFLSSVIAVLVHFFAEYMEHRLHDDPAALLWKNAGIWALALAVVLPIFSLCIRAWIGAFEFARSAHLFRAKHNALKLTSESMLAETEFGDTMRHIANVEHFMEHEHREWLRLVMSAEWFV